MNLPPHLAALARLVEAFHDEPTLGQLCYDLRLVAEALVPLDQAAETALRNAVGPAPPAPAAVPAPPPAAADFQIAYRLREAVGTYLAKPGPRAGWVPCRTPGCRDGWRGQ